MSRLWVTELSYARNEQPIFSDLNFQIRAGEVLVLSGRNGAGKTTLLKTLAGLIEPDVGGIFFQPGKHLSSPLHHHQAWLGDRTTLKPQWTALQNLQFLVDLRGRPFHTSSNNDPNHHLDSLLAALDFFELFKVRHQSVATFSQGMKKRLALAALSLCSAPLWLLDEPQAGLDQQGIARFEQMLDRHLSQQGLVVMASHHTFEHPNAHFLQLDAK